MANIAQRGDYLEVNCLEVDVLTERSLASSKICSWKRCESVRPKDELL